MEGTSPLRTIPTSIGKCIYETDAGLVPHDCYSAQKFDPKESRNSNGLARRITLNALKDIEHRVQLEAEAMGFSTRSPRRPGGQAHKPCSVIGGIHATRSRESARMWPNGLRLQADAPAPGY